jgi:MinD superfamily P-loop ATPase
MFIQDFITMATKNNIIAVLSGKGGTGKTLVSVNLAAANGKSTYIDCDVEEPNGHLFFKPTDVESKNVYIKIPVIDNDKCNGCRVCTNFCKFNALAYVGKVIVFEQVCHFCGGCSLICPQKAIKEKDKKIGQVKKGKSLDVTTYSGILDTGEITGVPIIQDLLKGVNDNKGYTFIDCPPGSACVVMESIKDANYCILVAEATIFGAHNLQMVYELTKVFNKKCGVVLNKCLDGFNPSEEFCKENNIDILARIPFDNKLGTINSKALIAVREDETYKKLFTKMLNRVKGELE